MSVHPPVSVSHLATEGDGQNRRAVGQPAGPVQEQQQEAGSCQVLQLPGSEEAAGSGAGPGGALQRHHSYTWASLPRHLTRLHPSNLKRKELRSVVVTFDQKHCVLIIYFMDLSVRLWLVYIAVNIIIKSV